MTKWRTILVPVDFFEPSQQAFQVACALARDHGSRVVVLHVATPPPFVRTSELHRALEVPDGYAQELDRRLQQEYSDSHLTIGRVLRDGPLVQQILDAVRDTGADLIVMGTHGRTGLERVLLGSVAEAVLRQASCPVLTIKGGTQAVPHQEGQ